MKKVFLIGGMSESGKSTFGKYLDSQGITRLKIVSFLQQVMKRENAEGDFYEWNDQQEAKRPEWLRREFCKEFLKFVSEEGIEYCCLESLYNPAFGLTMQEVMDKDRVVIVYIDNPLEVRLERQKIREGLTSLDEARAYLLPRDEKKKAWGTPQITSIADVIVDNSGTLGNLYRQADDMIKQYCPEVF